MADGVQGLTSHTRWPTLDHLVTFLCNFTALPAILLL